METHEKKTGFWLSIFLLLLLTSAVGKPAQAGTLIPQLDHTVCSSGCDFNTIQGAVNAADHNDTISLLFTAPHTEYDIIINKSVTIAGLGISNTIVQADATPGTAPNRVFFISAGLSVQFQDFTIRHGHVNGDGGAIYNDGSDLALTRMVIRNNNAYNGGGLFSSGGAITLNSSEIHNNNSNDYGAGIYNRGDLTIHDTSIYDNRAIAGAGGIYTNGDADIRGSEIYFNKVDGTASDVRGGGIYNRGILYLFDTSVDSNSLGDLNGAGSAGGGGIYSSGGETTIIGSRVRGNRIGDYMTGAGLYLIDNDTLISHSHISQNEAVGISANAGGLYMHLGSLTVNGSTIWSNESSDGGGLYLAQGDTNIYNSTVSSNTSSNGGGMVICNNQNPAYLTNVTISGNDATIHGGGIYVCANADVNLSNVTITDNHADSDNAVVFGDGGGIYLQTENNESGTAHIKNTLIAGNFDDTSFVGAIHAQDCFGTLTAFGGNLIGTLGIHITNTPCSIVESADPETLIGLQPNLEPLADNGGPTTTHALQPNSPAVNGGDPNGCSDTNDNPLPQDQRGALRIDRCDIGAFEWGGLLEKVDLPLVIRP